MLTRDSRSLALTLASFSFLCAASARAQDPIDEPVAADEPKHSATLLQDGKVLIAGGLNASGAAVATAKVYDLAAGVVQPTGALTTARGEHSATLLPDGRVLIAGGSDGQNTLDSLEIYEPLLGTFSALGATLGTARHGHTAVVVADGRVLIQGGSNAAGPVDTAEFFDPADDSVSETSPDGIARPSVATDWPDYYPGDVVIISGGGWLPGETVYLLFDEEPMQHYPRLLSAVADVDGNIANSEYVVEGHDLGTSFFLTASGADSGMTARWNFTDSPRVGSVTVGAQQAPNPVTAGSSTTFLVTVNRGSGGGSNGAFSATLSVTAGLPGGATASFSPNPVSFASADTSKTSTLTITTADTTATAASTITVKAETSASDSAAGNGTLNVKGGCDAVAAGTICRAVSAGGCDVAETCGAGSTACPANGFQSSATVCRISAGACDLADTCTGSSATCPTDAKSTAVCRTSAGACDAAESCNGVANTCPADSFLSSATVCRASAGSCDVAESCTGSAASCPADGVQSAATVCRASAGACDLADTCTGGSATCPVDAKSTAECRAARGACDLAESCDGVANACPADVRSTAECRASAGACDQAEVCPGNKDACPADTFQPPSTVCRASAGACDVADRCTGSAAACPADAKSTAVCRAASGACDVAESCDGTADACPADAFASTSTVCRGSAGACDVAESCTGTGSSCPADGFASAATQCRASAGACDTVESCTGTSVTCPADAKSTAVCRASNGPCDQAEVCPGNKDDCPADAFQPPSTVCRASAGSCDVDDKCTGSAATCPADAKSTAKCRNANGVCDLAEFCDGLADTCPTDVFEPTTTVCRASAGVCDVAESCTGSGGACPTDARQPTSVVCRTSAGLCDLTERCDGTSVACPTDDLMPNTEPCHDSRGENICDADEVCTGLSAQCPIDTWTPDVTKPALSCSAGATVNTSAQGGVCSASLNVSAPVTDNCDASIRASCSASQLSLTAAGSQTSDCTATDVSGNGASCAVSLTLVDDTPPTATCNSSVVTTASNNGLCQASLTAGADASDNCSGPVGVACVQGSLSLSSPGSSSTNCTATDGSGNDSAACKSTLTLVDNTLPSIECPAPQTLECSDGKAHVAVVAAATDNCDGQLAPQCMPGTGDYGLGTTAVDCDAVDAAGNKAPCMTTVTVRDTLPPQISCADDVEVRTSATQGNVCSAELPLVAHAADQCDGALSPSCSAPALTRSAPGTISGTCSASDQAHHSVSCDSKLTLVDDTDPAITCPSLQPKECDGPTGTHFDVQATVFDTCDADANLGCSPGSGNFGVGTTSTTCRAEDDSHNRASCQASIVVVDTEDPSITCTPSDTVHTSENTDGLCLATLEVAAKGTDRCAGELTPACHDHSLSLGAPGSASTSCSTNDGNGHSAECATSLKLIDDTAPSLTCVQPVTVECGGNRQGSANVAPEKAADNCMGKVTIAGCPDALTLFPVGTTSVTCGGEDESGNSAQCATSVTVHDTIAPKIVCPGDVVAECNGGSMATEVDSGHAEATDACGNAAVTDPAPATYNMGATAVTHIATDEARLTAECTNKVTVRDTTPPSIECPVAITAECTGNHQATVSAGAATASDICGDVDVVDPASASYPLGDTTVSHKATDKAHLSSECTQRIAVVDTTAPAISCPANVAAECTGRHQATVDSGAATASDVCGSVSVANPAPATFDLGNTNVVHVATDEAGQKSECSNVVTVADTTEPSITCPPNVTVECTGNKQATVDTGASTASDICGSVTVSDPARQAYALGTTSVTHSATDDAQNTNSCQSTIAVVDTIDPTITCAASKVVKTSEQGGLCSSSLPVSASASDSCEGSLGATCAASQLSRTQPGVSTTTCSVADGSGNDAGCGTSLTLVDDTKPVFDAGSLGARTFIGGCAGGQQSFALPTAMDNCGQAVAVSCSAVYRNAFGDNQVTCTATDTSGNSATAQIHVIVLEPLRVAFQPPLEDDNVANDIDTDVDVGNRFTSGQTIPHKVKLMNCAGADVTTLVAVTVKLDAKELGLVNGGTTLVADLAEVYNGVGGPGGLMILTDGNYHYNLSTNGYEKGTVNNSRFFRSDIKVVYNSNPTMVVGREDATLDSK